MHRSLVAVGVSICLFLPAIARADDPAAAQALFTDAKKLMASGQYAAACPKLEESQRLAPAVGTKFNLADCYEHTGKVASAWAAYLSVAAAAKNANQGAREKAARDRAAALEPKLSRLAVVVPQTTRVQGLEVKRDDVPIGGAEWGESMPVDPGEHTVTAAAPGKHAWKSIVAVEGIASTAKVIVPPLDDLPPEAPPAAPVQAAPVTVIHDQAPQESGSSSTLGWVLVGTGGAAVIGGAVFWAMRGSAQSKLESECGPGGKTCPPSATDDIANGKTYTALGVGLFAVGGVCLATGAGLLIFGKHGDAKSANAQLVPAVDARHAGLNVIGRF